MGSDLHTIIGNCIGGLGFLGLSITLFVRARSSGDNVAVFPQKLTVRADAGDLRSLLASGAQKLGLPFAAFIRFEKNKKANVVEIFSSRYSQFAPLKKGQTLDLSNLYCERFLRGNDLLAIDYASLSTWREHDGFKASGVETYLGVAIKVHGELVGSLSFFDEQARDQFFSSSEKEFVRSLGEKLSAKLASELSELPSSDSLAITSTASLNAEIL
jgi:hypothetical protein